MRTLPKPAFKVSQVLTHCVSGVSDPEQRAKYSTLSTPLVVAEADFLAQANAKAFHNVIQVSLVGGIATTDEMKKLYKDQMTALNGRGRAIYDALKNAAPNKKCPLCGVGVVSTLDHYLPQSKYPDLTVCPLNLVPACHDCNNAKRAKFPKNAGEQTIHPYFDDFSQAQWLHASLDRGPPIVVKYGTVTPPGWTPVDGQRALHHFNVFKLARLFGANAADELVTLKPTLAGLYKVGNAIEVQTHLFERVSEHSIRLNSWQHVLYSTLSQDAWFCSGGFGNIATP